MKFSIDSKDFMVKIKYHAAKRNQTVTEYIGAALGLKIMADEASNKGQVLCIHDPATETFQKIID